ncbi:MAG: Holliday junction branch migration protein RuvA [Thermodesulfobacteriota bacterium]|nr:Holliday junction branch migration protein RuvA [Thermodesulfobacteriota bacterium]
MLKGKIVRIAGKDITVMVGGVGYLVHIPDPTHTTLKCGQEVLLYTTLISREDSLDLYGFFDPKQREIFFLLLNVSGVGPKTAMGIVSQVDSLRFLDAVVSEDIIYLSSLPGIGKKSAQRIIFELKEKISKQYHPEDRGRKPDFLEDAVAALVTLGYSETQARQAVSGIRPSPSKTDARVEDIIKQALKVLMK